MERISVMKKNIDKRGSITLEAAIFLPVFIIGILTIAYLMKYIYAQENILYSICEEARLLSKNTYVTRAAPLFQMGVENRIEEENKGVSFVETTCFNPMYQEGELTDLIFYEAEYWMDIRLPIGLYDGFKGSETVVFRGFVGRRNTAEIMSFEEMEKEEESVKVWVFPAEGKRYHNRTCPFIVNYPARVILTKEIKEKFHPCSICDSNEAEIGQLVYCFYKSGKAYHLSDCPTVDKYVIEMEKEAAVKMGYTPCKTCGGLE